MSCNVNVWEQKFKQNNLNKINATSVTWLFTLNDNYSVNVGRNKLAVGSIFQYFIFECTLFVIAYIAFNVMIL